MQFVVKVFDTLYRYDEELMQSHSNIMTITVTKAPIKLKDQQSITLPFYSLRDLGSRQKLSL